VDIKKLGKIPNGGGWKAVGRSVGERNRHRHSPGSSPAIGYHYLHTAVDDFSRLAYSELLPDELGDTAAQFWMRARSWFASHGITVRRVLTDNGACYRSRAFAAALGSATHKRTRPYRPQTNGKVERLNRTLLEEWAYARPYRSDHERCEALADWLHHYNHHRGHTALGGLPPAARVPNLSGQYT
jgi:transposase InsO family protein